MRMRILLQAGMLLYGAAVAAGAQSLPNGRIELQITDKAGGIPSSAWVRIDPTTSQSQRILNVDSNGRLVIELAAGLHEITVSATGFADESLKPNIQSGETASIHVALRLNSVCSPCIVMPDDPATTMPVETVPPGENKPVLISNEPLPAIHLKALRVKPHRFWHFWR
jgi:hypothetical protein